MPITDTVWFDGGAGDALEAECIAVGGKGNGWEEGSWDELSYTVLLQGEQTYQF